MRIISIDWDFFIWNGLEAEGKLKVNGEEVSAAWFFDWGHSESYSPMLQEILWHTRYCAFSRNNMEMEKVAGINPEVGCTPIGEFLRILHKRFHLRETIVLSGDSHAWGYYAAQESESFYGALPITLFDAHFDLGYHNMEDEEKEGYFDCASWLYHAMKNKKVSQAEIVYPDWRGLKEWESVKNLPHIEKLGDRVKVTTWSDWVARNDPQEVVHFVNIARSSSWTPPYLDPEFKHLLGGISGGEYICLDCTAEEKIGGHDACRNRNWDLKAAKTFSDNTKGVMK